MAYVKSTNTVFLNDTGNNRIIWMKPLAPLDEEPIDPATGQARDYVLPVPANERGEATYDFSHPLFNDEPFPTDPAPVNGSLSVRPPARRIADSAMTGRFGVLVEDTSSPAASRIVPSGMAYCEAADHLLVTDNRRRMIYEYNLAGQLVAALDLSGDATLTAGNGDGATYEPGSLMGITVRTENGSPRIYIVDYTGDRVLRVDPAP